MNPDFDPNLEAQIDRRLKELPELAAPRGLIERTMKAVALTVAARPSRSWSSWPLGWRLAYVMTALCALGALFLGWRAAATALAATTAPALSRWSGVAKCVWATLESLAAAASLVMHHFGYWLAVVGLLGAVAYAACIGFGTLFFRYAFASNEESHL
jgi:hypothetical protein